MYRKYAKIVDRTSWTYRTMEKCEKQRRLLLLPQIQREVLYIYYNIYIQYLSMHKYNNCNLKYDPVEDPRG